MKSTKLFWNVTTYDKDLYEKTLKEDAREEGRAEGREEGMEYLNQLNKYLLKSKRYSDAIHLFLSSGMGFFFLIL